MTKKSNAAAKQDDLETELVDIHQISYDLAKEFFGGTPSVYTVNMINDFIAEADDDGIDDFKEALTRFISHVKEIYKTPTPTPEEVFGLFCRWAETTA